MQVNQYTDTQIFDIVKLAVDCCYFDLNRKFPEQAMYDHTVNGVTDWLQNNMPYFDGESIKKAFENGILGAYGEFFGLGKVTFIFFLQKYHIANLPKKEFKNTEMIKSKPLLPEQFDTAKGNAIEAYNTWAAYKAGISTRDIQRAASMNYDFLKSLGLITYGTEARQEIWKDATVRAISIVNDKKSKSDLFIRQALDVLKEKYQAGPDPDTEEYKSIAIEAKYITLCKYFDDIILSKTNFGELVECKREVFYNLKAKL